MRRLPLVLLALCLAVVSLPHDQQAKAMDNMTVLGGAELQKVFTDLVTDRVSLPKRDIEITNFSATPATIELPAGTVDFRIVSQSQAKQIGQQTIACEVLVDGVVEGQIKFSGDLKLYGDVVCAARALPRHSIIAAQDLERVRRDLSMLGPGLITDETLAIGKELETTLQPGAVLYGRFIKDPEVVKRGDIVSILVATDSLTITVPGRVQSAGAKGDMIKVKNLMSRKEIYAKVIGLDTVQAQF